MNLKSLVRDIPDFPAPNVLFRDIQPLLKDPDACRYVADNLLKKTDLSKIDFIAGIESRGFILGMLLAAHHGKGFLAIRKAGKLPPPVVKRRYALEYGEAMLEMNAGGGRVVIIDDVLATGGTMEAAIDLCGAAGYQVCDVAVLIDIVSLHKMTYNGRPIQSLIQY